MLASLVMMLVEKEDPHLPDGEPNESPAVAAALQTVRLDNERAHSEVSLLSLNLF